MGWWGCGGCECVAGVRGSPMLSVMGVLGVMVCRRWDGGRR